MYAHPYTRSVLFHILDFVASQKIGRYRRWLLNVQKQTEYGTTASQVFSPEI